MCIAQFCICWNINCSTKVVRTKRPISPQNHWCETKYSIKFHFHSCNDQRVYDSKSSDMLHSGNVVKKRLKGPEEQTVEPTLLFVFTTFWSSACLFFWTYFTDFGHFLRFQHLTYFLLLCWHKTDTSEQNKTHLYKNIIKLLMNFNDDK